MKSWFDINSYNSLIQNFNNCDKLEQIPELDDPELIHYFSGLQLLDGVPFSQLICDDNMLPNESLRFFYLDKFWIDCLTDGAFSIGRNCSRDIEDDKPIHRSIIEKSTANSQNLRRNRLGMPSLKIENKSFERTGFLLRSNLVNGWPGIQVDCYNKENEKLNLLRLNILGEDVLFCIVEGIISKVVFCEPEESLFFGFVYDNGIVLKLVSLDENEIGEELEEKDPIKVPFRMQDAKGVVDINSLAKEIINRLGIDDFSALEFAVEMINKSKIYSLEGELI